MSVPTDERKHGLGGFESLRGYHADRFVGKVQMQGNLELRWSLPDFTIWNQHLRPMLVPFVDVGRVFDKVGGFSVSDWKVTGGLSFRLAWNLATIVSFDYAYGSEGSLFYMELGHPF
jgi:outer membrane translocation and assembly module TamA